MPYNKKKILLHTLIIASSYYILGIITFTFFSQDGIITMAAFLPEGISLAAALIYGKKALPGIFLGQFILAYFSGLSLFSTLGISLVNTTEAMIAYTVFQYFKLNKELSSIRDIVGLIVIIIFILQPFSAIFGNGILLISQEISNTEYLQDVFYWWFGNVMGQLLIAPVILIVYYNREKINFGSLSIILLFFAVLFYYFQVLLPIQTVSLLLILTLPASIYLATKNLSYGSILSVQFATMSLYFTHLHIGTFTEDESTIRNIIDLNFFMLSHIILVLLVGTLIQEKNKAIELLKSMPHYDYLTGLPNRHLLREEIHHTVYLSHTHKYKNAICLLI